MSDELIHRLDALKEELPGGIFVFVIEDPLVSLLREGGFELVAEDDPPAKGHEPESERHIEEILAERTFDEAASRPAKYIEVCNAEEGYWWEIAYGPDKRTLFIVTGSEIEASTDYAVERSRDEEWTESQEQYDHAVEFLHGLVTRRLDTYGLAPKDGHRLSAIIRGLVEPGPGLTWYGGRWIENTVELEGPAAFHVDI